MQNYVLGMETGLNSFLDISRVSISTISIEIGEADKVLSAALDLHFEGNQWHFILTENIFKTQGKVVMDILAHKSSLPFYH